jgi:TolA-binding protein
VSKMRRFEWLRWGMTILMSAMACFGCLRAQDAANRTQPASTESSHDSVSDSVRELREQVRELQAAVAGMRSDWQRARAETAELRRELEEVRAGTVPRNAVLRDAVAKAEMATPEAVAGLQNGVHSAGSERIKKKRARGQPGRGIPVVERESGRSVSDESGKRVEV